MKAEAPNPFVVVLHLSVEKENYGHHWYELVKSVRPDCDYLDLDQHSEKTLLEHVRNAIEYSRPFILLIDVSSGTETPAGMGMLADAMLRHSSHCYAVLKGEHELIQKWLTPLKDRFIIYKGEKELKEQLGVLLNQNLKLG